MSMRNYVITAVVVIGVATLIGVALTVTDTISLRSPRKPSVAPNLQNIDTIVLADSMDTVIDAPKPVAPIPKAIAKQDTLRSKTAKDEPKKKKDEKQAGHGWTVSAEDSIYAAYEHTSGTKADDPGTGYFIRISKGKRQLTLFKDGEAVKIYPVGVGKNSPDKTRKEDNSTPEGNFKIHSISNSKDWKYEGVKAYGPWFMRLDTSNGAFSGKSWTGIGIHGTSNENSIGGFVSHGCIRMFNNDITELKTTIEEQVQASEVKVVVLP